MAFPEPQRFNELQDLADQVRSGRLTRPDYAEILGEVAREMASHEQQLRSLDVPDEAAQALQAELSAGLRGLALMRQGVDRMRRYAEEPLELHLEEGLQLVGQGQAELVLAVQMNRRSREELERRFREG